MTSSGAGGPPGEAFVWVWLPGATEPVVAGRLARDGGRFLFNYGRRYLERPDAVPLYDPELPLMRGAIAPPAGLRIAGALRDAAPDAWGQRVIVYRRLGLRRDHIDVDALDLLTYLLDSGSDRIGALDVQRSSSVYEPRGPAAAPLEQLLDVVGRIERQEPVDPSLALAIFHGSSVGGARPKALIEDADEKWIAKFASVTDVHDVVRAEFVAMRLAARIGLDVAPVRLVDVAGRAVLLVRRFDRHRVLGGWRRSLMVSGLTLLGIDELMARYASYESLAEIVRLRFADPDATLRELFGRLLFNVLCGNTDDHARNHAAFWDGARLRLTPAFDICPQPRTGGEASQAMLIRGDDRMSRIATCIAAAPQFHLTPARATAIAVAQIEAIEAAWASTCDAAGLGPLARRALWGRQFFNPYALDGAPDAIRRRIPDRPPR